MKERKAKNIFVEGPIRPDFIAESIRKHATKHDIGAHEIFLGQIRADGQGRERVYQLRGQIGVFNGRVEQSLAIGQAGDREFVGGGVGGEFE